MSQVGRLTERGRGEKERLQSGVFIRASKMACLPPTALEFPFEVIWFLHSCHAPPLTPRRGSPPSPCMHRIAQSSDSKSGVRGVGDICGALIAARESLFHQRDRKIKEKMRPPGNLWIMFRHLGIIDVKIFEMAGLHAAFEDVLKHGQSS